MRLGPHPSPLFHFFLGSTLSRHTFEIMSSLSSSIAEVISMYQQEYAFIPTAITEEINSRPTLRLTEDYMGFAMFGLFHRSSANVHYEPAAMD